MAVDRPGTWTYYEDVENNNKGIHSYPVGAKTDDALEGSFKRYYSLPTIQDVRDIAFVGLKRLIPTIDTDISDRYIEIALSSAMVEIETKLGCPLTPGQYNQSFDYVDGFWSNWSAMTVNKWPATAVLDISIKFAHVLSDRPVLKYQVPPQWIALYKNKINIIASQGTMARTTDQSDVAFSAFFAANYGFDSSFRPQCFEVVYQAGFPNDKIPATMFDLIVTVTGINLLSELAPVLFPNTSTAVQTDGVSQSAGTMGPHIFLSRVEELKRKRKDLEKSLRSAFGKTMTMTFVGNG